MFSGGARKCCAFTSACSHCFVEIMSIAGSSPLTDVKSDSEDIASSSLGGSPRPCAGSSPLSSIDDSDSDDVDAALSTSDAAVASDDMEVQHQEDSDLEGSSDDLEAEDTPSHIVTRDLADAAAAAMPCGLLISSLRKLAAMGNIAFGSGCSGIDIFLPAVCLLCSMLCDIFSIPKLTFKHVFSCDNDESRQRWLRDVMGVTCVFTDLLSLPSGSAFDFVQQRMRSVKDIFVWTCGFSCKSVSRSNKNAAKFKNCLKYELGTTGKTCRAAIRTVALLLPILLFMENVQGLSAGDRAFVIRELEKLGYLVCVIVSDLSRHGVPCRRVRVWFLAVLLPGASDELKASTQTCAQHFEVLFRRRPLSLSRYLLTPEDPEFDQHQTDHRRSKGKGNRGDKWKAQHKQIWKGLESESCHAKPHFPQSWKGMFEKFPFTPREKDVSRLEIARNKKDYETKQFLMFDVSQSAHRLPRGLGMSPTILPCGKLIISNLPGQGEPRPLFGIEALALQGFDFAMLTEKGASVARSDFDGAFYRSAAGNAYSVPQAQLAVLIALCIFELPQNLEEVAQRRTAARNFKARRA